MLEKIREFFAQGDSRVAVFVVSVVILLILRAAGFAGLAVFLALIYIMWFVSVDRR